MVLLTPKGYFFQVESLNSYELTKLRQNNVKTLTLHEYDASEQRETGEWPEPYGINNERTIFFCDRGFPAPIEADLITFLLNFSL